MPAPVLIEALPPEWYIYTVSPGVDPGKRGIYEWKIEDAGSYIGQYSRIDRPTKAYGRNVTNLMNNKPYRPKKPDGFRRIHRELERAHRDGRLIELIILENAEKPGINDRERQLVAERGSLNDPPYG